MAKKQTRRSISVSGDTYNAVRDYCDRHGLSASGLVTDLLNKYLVDNADGPPPPSEEQKEEFFYEPAEAVPQPVKSSRPTMPIRVTPPQAVRDVKYPDRRGPGFSPLTEGGSLSSWMVTAHLEISRKRQIDAQTSVETLLQNLMHRRMVNTAQVVKVELVGEE